MDYLKWKVIGKIKEAHDAYTFVLQHQSGLRVDYQAGQFLTLIFQHNGEEVRRSYSISSSPRTDEHISITVKRVANGEISRHLINHVHVNDELSSIKPAGRFTFETDQHAQHQFFFIAAGSGIVPMFSLIKNILIVEPLSKIVLLNQNHAENEIIFKKQLELLAKQYPARFKLLSFLSKPIEESHHPQKLNNFLLEKIVRENRTEAPTFFYLCGPLSFMRMAQFTLRWMGFEEEQIKKENFVIDFIPPPPLMDDYSMKKVMLRHSQQIQFIETAYPKTILQAALDNNIQLPYSCRAGSCGTCAAKCLKGKVLMSNNEVLTEKDLQEGLVLTCVGYALTDLDIEL